MIYTGTFIQSLLAMNVLHSTIFSFYVVILFSFMANLKQSFHRSFAETSQCMHA